MTDVRRRTADGELIWPEHMKPVKAFSNVIDFNNLNEPRVEGNNMGSDILAIAVGSNFYSFHQLCSFHPGLLITGGQLEVLEAFTAKGDLNLGSTGTATDDVFSLWINDEGDDLSKADGSTKTESKFKDDNRITDFLDNVVGKRLTGLVTITNEDFARDEEDDVNASVDNLQLPPLRFPKGGDLLLGIKHTAATQGSTEKLFTAGKILVAVQFIEYQRRDEIGLFKQFTRAQDSRFNPDKYMDPNK